MMDERWLEVDISCEHEKGDILINEWHLFTHVLYTFVKSRYCD